MEAIAITYPRQFWSPIVMSRRKNSAAEDFLDLVAMLPWWFGVVLAVLSYVLLHRVAGHQVSTTVQPGHVAGLVIGTFTTTLAAVGQYLIPLLCFIGAGASAWKRHERKALVQNVVQSKSADALDDITWQEFERLVGEAFRLQGYAVAETGGRGADGGIDLVLSKGEEKFLVQCKQWRAFRVGVEVVRELYGVMAAKGAAGGFVVTSGRFTEEATSFASGRNVKLVDGPKLHALIQQAQAARRGAGVPSSAPVKAAATPSPSSPPACPLCSKPMVKRLARRGANAGSEFWGCTGYPACRGTSSVA